MGSEPNSASALNPNARMGDILLYVLFEYSQVQISSLTYRQVCIYFLNFFLNIMYKSIEICDVSVKIVREVSAFSCKIISKSWKAEKIVYINGSVYINLYIKEGIL